MHRIQSVQRLVKNHTVVPTNMKNESLGLFYCLKRTEVQSTFLETIGLMYSKFTNCRRWLRWLRWWMRFAVSSMAFKSQSLMKNPLASHRTSTSNSIEAYHGALYKAMPNYNSFALALRYILQFAKGDLVMARRSATERIEGLSTFTKKATAAFLTTLKHFLVILILS
ncbi:uncharacterized protein B0P05DRAFT_103797 [Gilbertella persicaria]|uniref:uncharacterized protein n=1 Tax=Gilbertella persicaria TaxID=101096 RepID=UPI00221FFD4F|nr:uncharacterized protein B0P05DRAFT_103797 [Gilbertella persicaria]KAI8078932.1 hypothetical protein B0P05DRAFT_103797 [Gilbertella persicaria]